MAQRDAGDDQTITLSSGQTSINVQLNGSGNDPDGTITAYTWTGTPDPDDIQNPSVSLMAGTYTFTLVVWDNDGSSSIPDNVTITVRQALVTVPDVVSMTQAAAESAILAVNLTVGTITTANSPTVPAGEVISQNPAAGTSVAEGSAVSLLISIGSAAVCSNGETRPCSTICGVGTETCVNEQWEACNAPLPEQELCDDFADNDCDGAADMSDPDCTGGQVVFTVPDVLGLDRTAAETEITGAGLSVGEVMEENSYNVPAGGVITQYPPPGSVVSQYLQVDIFVSLGAVTDNDGVDDAREDGAPNNGDGNRDGIPDRMQANVASFPNIVDGRYVTLVSPRGTVLTDVEAVPNPSPADLPAGVGFPIGLFSFRVQGLDEEGNITVTLLLPSGVMMSTYHRYGPTPDNPVPHWYEFLYDGTTGAEIRADRVILHFADGLRGDDDLTANHEIADSGGVSYGPCSSAYSLEPGQWFYCALLPPETGGPYEWDLVPGEAPFQTLPPGLQLTADIFTPGIAYIRGTVEETAPLIPSTAGLELRLRSSGSVIDSRSITFNIGKLFTLWTQNTILRPPDAIPDEVLILACLFPGNPVCITGMAFELKYDSEVQNTASDNRDRTRRILDKVSNYDIVAFQELFDSSNLEQIRDNSPGHYLVPGPPGAGIEASSGLALLQKIGISPSLTQLSDMFWGHHGVVYDDCNRTLDDCMSQKGFTLDRVHIGNNPDHFIYLVNTHTQSSKPEDIFVDQEIRRRQFNQIRDFIGINADTDHPVLIMGDFNVREHDGEYYGMLSAIGLDREDDLFRRIWSRPGDTGSGLPVNPGYTWDQTRNAYAYYWFDLEEPQRLDYILVRQGNKYMIEADFIDITDDAIVTDHCRHERWPSNMCYLSDHFGMEAHLRLAKKSPELAITIPEDGSTYLEGGIVTFGVSLGSRLDLKPQVRWDSDIDGFIGFTNTVRWEALTLGTVTPGIHTITASVTDSDGIVYDDSITIVVLEDSDRDGLSNDDELIHGTNLNDPDSDDDGLSDGEEVHVYHSDPLDPDMDGDGLSDGYEVSIGANPFITDSDRDGLPDIFEFTNGTNLANTDTDGDGAWDGVELILGSSPTDSASTPFRVPAGILYAATGWGSGGYLAVIDPLSGLIGHVGNVFGWWFGFGLEFDEDGSLFVAQTTSLATADPLTAQDTAVGPLQTSGGEVVNVSKLAFNNTDRTLYGAEEGPGPGFLPTGQLLRIDRNTGVVTRIGTPAVGSLHALAFRQDGVLFASIEADPTSDRLVTLNPATGEVVQDIGLIGHKPVFGLAFTQAGDLWATALKDKGFESKLLSINQATGAGTTIAEFGEALFDIALSVEKFNGVEDFSDDSNPSAPGLASSVFVHSLNPASYGWELVDEGGWTTPDPYPSPPHALGLLFDVDTITFNLNPGRSVVQAMVRGNAYFGRGTVQFVGTGDTKSLAVSSRLWHTLQASSTDIGDSGNPMGNIVAIRLSGGEVLFDNIEIVRSP